MEARELGRWKVTRMSRGVAECGEAKRAERDATESPADE